MDTGFVAAEDERQILRLCALYCHHFNHGAAEDWAALFAPDGRFVKLNASHGGLGTGGGATVGTAELLDMAHGRRALFKGLVRHQQTDIVIQPGRDADHAAAKSIILVTDWRDGPGRIAALGDCETEFVRTPQGWRFASITLSTLPRPQQG